MILTAEEALYVIILTGYYFAKENIIVRDNPIAEGLGEVKLLRKIAREFPNLKSHVELVIEESSASKDDTNGEACTAQGGG